MKSRFERRENGGEREERMCSKDKLKRKCDFDGSPEVNRRLIV